MNEAHNLAANLRDKSKPSRPPGPQGAPLMGVMRDFNRDQLGFIERARDEFGDIVWMRFLYVPALFLYHPDEIEYVLVTNAKNFIKSMSLRSNFFQRLVGNGGSSRQSSSASPCSRSTRSRRGLRRSSRVSRSRA